MSNIESTRSSVGFEILKIALVLGILGDVLLRATPWGLNVLLFNVVFVTGFAVLLWRHAPQRLTSATVALMGAQIFFAAMFVWRDSAELKIADTIAIIAILSIQLLPELGITQRLAGTFHFVIGFLWSGISAMFAPAALLASDIEWSAMPDTGWRKHAVGTLRGVVIATPLVLIFGGLFVAADAAYEGMVARALNIDFATVFSHGILLAIFSWLSMGYLRGAVISPLGAADIPVDEPLIPARRETHVSDVVADAGAPAVTLPDSRTVVEHLNISDEPNVKEATVGDDTTEEKNWTWSDITNSLLPPAFRLGTTEVAVILGAMNLLFLSFVIVQVPYLFGGMELVQTTPDFKLAEYARRGFGELVTVSALVLPTLLIGQWLIRREATRAQLLFKVLAGTQIALLFVIMASAVQRLLILTGSLGYGMTTVRLYPMIFMTWLAVVFVWFGATVLRGARQYFAWGALWSALVFLGATHVLNPDAFIVRTNLELMHQGREFDGTYNASLSDDSLPVLIGSFNELSPDEQIRAFGTLRQRYCRKKLWNSDLRSWNVDRRTASETIAPFVETFEQGCAEVSRDDD